MASKLDWIASGRCILASTRQRNKVGIAFWRLRKLANGRWDASNTTPWLLGNDDLERWPMFDTLETAKLWCEAADERLAGGVR